MMDTTPITLIETCMQALQEADFQQAGGYLADDFIFIGWTPKPLDKEGLLGLVRGLKEGIPGLAFNLTGVKAEAEIITGRIHVTGYQSKDFILPALGTPPIPQTGSTIDMPEEQVTYRVRAGKLISWTVHPTTDGGIRGLFRQLGIDLLISQ